MIAIASLLFITANLDVSALRRPLSPVPACAVDTVWKHAAQSDGAIARQVPGYAGSTADSALIVTIYVSDLRDGESAKRALKEELLRRFGVYHFVEARVERVRYSYRQLQSWLECIIDSARPGDVRVSGIESLRNRVSLLVVDAAAHTRVSGLLRELSIPARAVTLQLSTSHH